MMWIILFCIHTSNSLSAILLGFYLSCATCSVYDTSLIPQLTFYDSSADILLLLLHSRFLSKTGLHLSISPLSFYLFSILDFSSYLSTCSYLQLFFYVYIYLLLLVFSSFVIYVALDCFFLWTHFSSHSPLPISFHHYFYVWPCERRNVLNFVFLWNSKHGIFHKYSVYT